MVVDLERKKPLWELNINGKESVDLMASMILDPAFSFSITAVLYFISTEYNTDKQDSLILFQLKECYIHIIYL